MIETLLIITILLLAFQLYLSVLGKGKQTIQNNTTELQRIEQQIKNDAKDLRLEFNILISNLFKNFGETISSKTNGNLEALKYSLKESRDELSNSLQQFDKTYREKVDELNNLQRIKFSDLSQSQTKLMESTENRLEKMRETIENKLIHLQEENAKKLEEMRCTVDEKLNNTLETRLGESFRLVSERLEQVQNGLGEMKNLAVGVGDLKKMLNNVKTRGTMGEIQLGNILEQVLSPEQFEKNVAIKQNSSERIEYAVRLPGRNEIDDFLYLPIDSKFPLEDYQRLIETYDLQLSPKEVEEAGLRFENIVKRNAKEIHEKYLNPPKTTDFAIMFLPTEGLYAEVLRRTGLFESLQRDFKITPVGPSNLVAFLSSLQMGFRTLAVEKRSSEVWNLLAAVKNEFSKFGVILERTEKQLKTVSNTIEEANRKTKTIEKKLKNVQELPELLSFKTVESSVSEINE